MKTLLLAVIAVLACSRFLEAAISNGCISCICQKESGCRAVTTRDWRCKPGCNWDVNSCSCGPYQIKKPYFTDCSSAGTLPIKDWISCATNFNCAKQCVQNYMKRYGSRCTGKPESRITCGEYAGIHNGGPRGCNSRYTTAYRNSVQACCSRRRDC